MDLHQLRHAHPDWTIETNSRFTGQIECTLGGYHLLASSPAEAEKGIRDYLNGSGINGPVSSSHR